MLSLPDLINLDTRPSPYQSGAPLWTDPHIAKGMLEAHLSPTTDAASYRPDKINAICDQLSRVLPLADGADLIDLGCGPGLYCAELSKKGYHLTGIDQSENSIQYARSHAPDPSVTYVLGSYLEPFGSGTFDAALLIYEDFGVFGPENRRKLLGNIHQALRPGGWFVLDVASRYAFSMRQRCSHADWYASDAGFWRPGRHFVFEKPFFYEQTQVDDNRSHVHHPDPASMVNPDPAPMANPAICDFYAILDETLTCYRIWQTYFSPESIRTELAEAGFVVRELYSDLTGAAYHEVSPVLGLICQRADQPSDLESVKSDLEPVKHE